MHDLRIYLIIIYSNSIIIDISLCSYLIFDGVSLYYKSDQDKKQYNPHFDTFLLAGI